MFKVFSGRSERDGDRDRDRKKEKSRDDTKSSSGRRKRRSDNDDTTSVITSASRRTDSNRTHRHRDPDDDSRERRHRSERKSSGSLTEGAVRALDDDDDDDDDESWESDEDDRHTERTTDRRSQQIDQREGESRSTHSERKHRSSKASEKSSSRRSDGTKSSSTKSRDKARAHGDEADRALPAMGSFDQFPGMYSAAVVRPSDRPEHTMSGALPLDSHVPNQFPGQNPSTYAKPAFDFNPHGAAADYYNDQGQSVSFQPGIRPHTPMMLHNPDTHLITPSAAPVPVADTGHGSAADFYSGRISPVASQTLPSAGTNGPEFKPSKPGKSSGKLSTGIASAVTAAAVGSLIGHKPSKQSSSTTFPTKPARHNSEPVFASSSTSYSTPAAVPGLYTAAGAAALGAAAYGIGHAGGHDNRLPSTPSNQNTSYYNSGASIHHQHYHEHKSPLAKIKDGFFNLVSDPDDVRKMEAYTEYIGVCKYCFDPRSSPWDGPRQHHYHPRKRDSFESLRRRVSNDRLRRKSSGERIGMASRIEKDSRYAGRGKGVSKAEIAGLGALGAGAVATGAMLWGNGKDFDDTYSVKSGRRIDSSKRRTSRSSSRERRRRTSYGVIGPNREEVKWANVRTKDGTVELRKIISQPKSRSRSRSKSRNRTGDLFGVASGAVLGAAALGAADARHASNKHRHGEKVFIRRRGSSSSRSRNSSPGLADIFGLSSNKPKARTSRRHSPSRPTYAAVRRGSSPRKNDGLFGGFFSEPKPRRHSRSRKDGGFFTFSNASASSSDSELAFGDNLPTRSRLGRQASKTSLRGVRKPNRRTSEERMTAAVVGIGATAAALAAAQRGQRISKRASRPELGARRHTREFVEGHSIAGAENDDWEDELPSDATSVSSHDSGLAFGSDARRGRMSRQSMDSLASRTSEDGLAAWAWRWGSKKQKSRKHKPSSDGIYDSRQGPSTFGSVAIDSSVPGPSIDRDSSKRTNSSGVPPPLQYIDPRPLSETGSGIPSRNPSMPGGFDTYDSASRQRPGPGPLQQPQPIAPFNPSFSRDGVDDPQLTQKLRRAQTDPVQRDSSWIGDAALIGGAALATAGIIAAQGKKSKDSSNVRFGLTDDQQRKEDDIRRREREREADDERRRQERTRQVKEEAARTAREEDGRRQRDRERTAREEAEHREKARAAEERRARAQREADEQARRETEEKRRKAQRDSEERAKREADNRDELERNRRRAAERAEQEARQRKEEREFQEQETRYRRERERQRDLEEQNRFDNEDHHRKKARYQSKDLDSDQHKAEGSRSSSSWKTPVAAGIAGAVVGSVLDGTRHKDSRSEDRYDDNGSRADRYAAKTVEPSNEHSGAPILDDDLFDPNFFKRKRSQSEVARYNESADKVVSEREAYYNAPVQTQAEIFAPKELLNRAAGEKERSTDPMGGNDVHVWHASDDEVSRHFDHPSYAKDYPTGFTHRSIPQLNVIAPTPPPTHSPRQKPRKQVDIPSVEKESKTPDQDDAPKSRGRAVSWGQDQTHVYQPRTPESIVDRGSYVEAHDSPSLAQDEIIVEEDVEDGSSRTTRYDAKDMSKDSRSATTSAKSVLDKILQQEGGVEEMTRDGSDPSGARRPSKPQAFNYKQPFYDSVSDIAFSMDSPGTEGAPPVRGWVEDKEVETPLSNDKEVNLDRKSRATNKDDDYVTGGRATPSEVEPDLSTLSKKERKKHEKMLKRFSVEGETPAESSSTQDDAVQDDEFSRPLSKKEKKKRDKASKRSSTVDSITEDSSAHTTKAAESPVLETPTFTEEPEQDDDFTTLLLSKKEKKKREKAAKRSSTIDSVTEDSFADATNESSGVEATGTPDADEEIFLSKKEKKKRAKAAQRDLIEADSAISTPSNEHEETATTREAESQEELPLTGQEKSRLSSLFGRGGIGSVVETVMTAGGIAALAGSASRSPDPEQPPQAIQETEPEQRDVWDDSSKKDKKSKRKKKLGESFDTDPRDIVSFAEQTNGSVIVPSSTTASELASGMPGGWDEEEPSREETKTSDNELVNQASTSDPELVDAEDIWAEAPSKKSKKKQKRAGGLNNEPVVSSPLRSELAQDRHAGQKNEPDAGSNGHSRRSVRDMLVRDSFTGDFDYKSYENETKKHVDDGDITDSRRSSSANNDTSARDIDHDETESADYGESNRSKRRSRQSEDANDLTPYEASVPKEKKKGILGSIFGRKSDEGAPTNPRSTADDNAEKDEGRRRHRRRRTGSEYGDDEDSRSIASSGYQRRDEVEDDVDDYRRKDYDPGQDEDNPDRHRRRRKHRTDHERTDSRTSEDQSFLEMRVEDLPPLPASRSASPTSASNRKQDHGRPVSAEAIGVGMVSGAALLATQLGDGHVEPHQAHDRDILPPLPESEPTSPVSPVYSTPRPGFPVRPVSSTAVPLRFRPLPKSPQQGHSRSGSLTSPVDASPISPGITMRPKTIRARTTDTYSGEYKPLYLAERHSKAIDPVEENLPSLPSSKPSSRSSSVHGSEDYHSAAESVHASPRSERSLRIDTDVARQVRGEDDILDSQQTTPRAGAFDPDSTTLVRQEPQFYTWEDLMREHARNVEQDARGDSERDVTEPHVVSSDASISSLGESFHLAPQKPDLEDDHLEAVNLPLPVETDKDLQAWLLNSDEVDIGSAPSQHVYQLSEEKTTTPIDASSEDISNRQLERQSSVSRKAAKKAAKKNKKASLVAATESIDDKLDNEIVADDVESSSEFKTHRRQDTLIRFDAQDSESAVAPESAPEPVLTQTDSDAFTILPSRTKSKKGKKSEKNRKASEDEDRDRDPIATVGLATTVGALAVTAGPALIKQSRQSRNVPTDQVNEPEQTIDVYEAGDIAQRPASSKVAQDTKHDNFVYERETDVDLPDTAPPQSQRSLDENSAPPVAHQGLNLSAANAESNALNYFIADKERLEEGHSHEPEPTFVGRDAEIHHASLGPKQVEVSQSSNKEGSNDQYPQQGYQMSKKEAKKAKKKLKAKAGLPWDEEQSLTAKEVSSDDHPAVSDETHISTEEPPTDETDNFFAVKKRSKKDKKAKNPGQQDTTATHQTATIPLEVPSHSNINEQFSEEIEHELQPAADAVAADRGSIFTSRDDIIASDQPYTAELQSSNVTSNINTRNDASAFEDQFTSEPVKSIVIAQDSTAESDRSADHGVDSTHSFTSIIAPETSVATSEEPQQAEDGTWFSFTTKKKGKKGKKNRIEPTITQQSAIQIVAEEVEQSLSTSNAHASREMPVPQGTIAEPTSLASMDNVEKPVREQDDHQDNKAATITISGMEMKTLDSSPLSNEEASTNFLPDQDDHADYRMSRTITEDLPTQKVLDSKDVQMKEFEQDQSPVEAFTFVTKKSKKDKKKSKRQALDNVDEDNHQQTLQESVLVTGETDSDARDPVEQNQAALETANTLWAEVPKKLSKKEKRKLKQAKFDETFDDTIESMEESTTQQAPDQGQDPAVRNAEADTNTQHDTDEPLKTAYDDHLREASDIPLPDDQQDEWSTFESVKPYHSSAVFGQPEETSPTVTKQIDGNTPIPDFDFAATLAAGLAGSGFDPDLVTRDPVYHRRASPPGIEAEAVPHEADLQPTSRKQKKRKGKMAVRDEALQESSSTPTPRSTDSPFEEDFESTVANSLQATGFDASMLERSRDVSENVGADMDNEPSFATSKRKKSKKSKTPLDFESTAMPSQNIESPKSRRASLADDVQQPVHVHHAAHDSNSKASWHDLETKLPYMPDPAVDHLPQEKATTVVDSPDVLSSGEMDVDEMDKAYKAYKRNKRKAKKEKYATARNAEAKSDDKNDFAEDQPTGTSNQNSSVETDNIVRGKSQPETQSTDSSGVLGAALTGAAIAAGSVLAANALHKDTRDVDNDFKPVSQQRSVIEPQADWSFSPIDAESRQLRFSPGSPDRERHAVRDSGYQSIDTPVLSQAPDNAQFPDSRRQQQSSRTPLHIDVDTDPDWTVQVSKQRRPDGDRTQAERNRSRTPSGDTPLEPTSRNRASYLFQSPPETTPESKSQQIGLVSPRRELDHDENVRSSIEQSPSARAGLNTIVEESNGRKRSIDMSHVDPQEQGNVARRRLASPDGGRHHDRELSRAIRSSRSPEAVSGQRSVTSPLDARMLAGFDTDHGKAGARRVISDTRSPSALSNRSNGSVGIHRIPDELRSFSRASSGSGVTGQGHSLRRTSMSGDLRAASRASLRGNGSGVGQRNSPKTIPFEPPPTPPSYEDDEQDLRLGASRAVDMADVYQGLGGGHEAHISPTRPPSVRKRQSMHILELESRLDQLAAENRALSDARQARGPHGDGNDMRQVLEQRELELREKDAELHRIQAMLRPMQAELDRLTEINDGLTEANRNLVDDTNGRYATLQAEHEHAHQQWQSSSRELDDMRSKQTHLATNVKDAIAGELSAALAEKDNEIRRLREELEVAAEQIRALQVQIQSSRHADFLVQRDEDYFDGACQRLCQHAQQWVLRFSKSSDNRICRLSTELNDDKIEARLDNAILDGSDVDKLLGDRTKRRDVFMSVVTTMIWEYVFTRYLFGMDREQRQKLKTLEKTLSEVGPPRAVAQWRATTLTLLSKRPSFAEQCILDTEAVAHEIYAVLNTLLPPPSGVESQLIQSLQRVVKVAVDLSIEMRTQRAEFIMLPPLQPEYDSNGELVRKMHFNAALMNERSGMYNSNEELEADQAVVKLVLFPPVVKKGDDFGKGAEEIVVCPAQVLVHNDGGRGKKVVRVMSGAMDIDDPRASRQSLISTAPGPSVMS